MISELNTQTKVGLKSGQVSGIITPGRTITSSKISDMLKIYTIIIYNYRFRILKYDPGRNIVQKVLDGLYFPNGLQLSKDESSLLFTETSRCRVQR